MGSEPDAELTETENENIAEQIECMLEEWKTDFDDENTKRKELRFYIKMASGETLKNKDFDFLLTETAKTLQHKMGSIKPDVGINKTVDDSDDAILGLETQLDEKNEKIKDC